MKWFIKLLNIKHTCKYSETDVYMIDDPECIHCGKLASVAAKEKGITFVNKSIKKMHEEFFKKNIERGAGDDYPVITPQNWK